MLEYTSIVAMCIVLYKYLCLYVMCEINSIYPDLFGFSLTLYNCTYCGFRFYVPF